MSRVLLLMALAIAVSAAPARAQLSISGGLEWSGGYDIGQSSAQLRTNATGATPPSFTLFDVDSRLAASPGGELRVTVPVARAFAIEGGVHFTRRRLAFQISRDAEGGAHQLEGESLQQYVFDAAVLWELPRAVQRERLRVYATGGAAYLRQLHQDRTLVEHGQVYSAGGSARWWLRGRPGARSAGVRGDVRLNLRRNGIDFANEARVYPTASIMIFLGL